MVWRTAEKRQADGIAVLDAFGDALEKASLDTINSGIMTKDLVGLVDEGTKVTSATSKQFIAEVGNRLAKLLAFTLTLGGAGVRILNRLLAILEK